LYSRTGIDRKQDAALPVGEDESPHLLPYPTESIGGTTSPAIAVYHGEDVDFGDAASLTHDDADEVIGIQRTVTPVTPIPVGDASPAKSDSRDEVREGMGHSSPIPQFSSSSREGEL
jgi:hypothetical protein